MNFCLFTYNAFIRWLQANMLTCPLKKYLHIECPGCGLQRSFIALLNGDVRTSLQLYPATLPLLFLMVFTIFHLKYKFLHGAATIKYLYVGVAFVVLVFYIYKIVNHKIIA
jgi:Protein of unknown function (DUF2752)